ncbi:hypothetical protein FPY71_10090 [Aureimonas fodinaquatilis]|uniref:Uncharacterized protein n=1 Tax=Aureimonas fodinaquatilis TaxID=2565783 RepID=A0A5B0DWE1_9HYPH|nr:hypothetical protein [Aureimonas fodinaquatilis]KAA0970816.1 hypothetical protein FPY71_10090 [Aureimonas fodinaquatilis]
MSKQVTLENLLPGGFGLPTGQVIPGRGSIVVEPEIWEASKDHPVVAAQVKAGAIIVDGKGRKQPEASDVRDENGDTPEMAEMRKRFDASFAALTTELQAEKSKVGDLEARLAVGQSEQDGPKAPANQAGCGYAIAERGPGWFSITFDGKEVTKGLRKDAVERFEKLSDADKKAFVQANKAEA